MMRTASLVVLAVLAATVPAAQARTANPRGKGCDRLDDAACLLPFPHDAFTTPSASPSGRRLHLTRSMMPRNAKGTPIDPTPFKTFDGFSPGSVILSKVRGLDTPAALRRTNPVGLSDLSRYRARNAPVIVFDTITRKRVPIWVELDSKATRPRNRLLEIHPAKNLAEGHRFLVVLRNLRTAHGRRIGAGRRFARLRDGKTRTSRYQSIFRALRRAHVKRNASLFLTWDFTVASERSLSGRLQTMRDQSFAALGDPNLADAHIDGSPPAFTATPASAAGTPYARVIEGTVDVPCYLTPPACAPGGRFFYARTGDFLPAQKPGNVAHAHFTCVVPTTATPAHPAQLVLYSHGLLGSDREVLTSRAIQASAREQNAVFCATPAQGMSTADVANDRAALQDVSKMPTVADALQQGLLNALFLGRLMAHPQGLATNPLLRSGGRPIIATGDRSLVFAGGSQGAILGGALTAFAPDFTRAVLNVPGMNYSVLLPRSVDFDAFKPAFEPAYKDQLERPLVLDLAQLQWDRGESDGVAAHITDHPLPNTPPHQVLLQTAFGDHQVSQFQADVLARTVRARVRQPELAPGRSPQRRPTFGLSAAPAGSTGSVMSYWDAGPGRVAPPPLTNVPNRALEDPHGYPGLTAAARAEAGDFLHGSWVDHCGGAPCVAAPDPG